MHAHELVRHGLREAWTVENEAVELAVLAAGVDAVRQVGDEALIELAAAKARVEKSRIDADDARAIAEAEQLVDQRAARS